jgi:hypothetical protein
MSTRPRRFGPAWAALLMCVAAAGCATARMDLPKDFLELEGRSDFQAVTADDARVWVRQFKDRNEAPLAFWVGVLEHEFTTKRGYEVVKKGEVNASLGKGSWFECAANVRGERMGYLVAVWASGSDITVAEFVARAEVFATRVDEVRAALTTVRI